MHNFSMKLDLSNFFDDARSCSLVLIDATWENVKDLQDHIQSLFQLSKISLLTNDGCYLPPKESIRVLKSIQSVKAFTLNLTNCSEHEVQNCSPVQNNDIDKKRKNRSAESEVELASSTPNLPKRSKIKKSTLTPNETAVEEPSSSPDSSKGFNKKSTRKKKVKGTKQETQVNSLQTSIINKHVVFEEDDAELPLKEITAVDKEESKLIEEVVFRCSLLELDSKSVRTFELPSKSHSIKILENIIIPAPFKESLAIDIEPVDAAAIKKSPLTNSNSPCSQIEPEISIDENMTVTAAVTSVLVTDSEDDIMLLDDSIRADVKANSQISSDKDMEIIAEMLSTAVPLTHLPNIGQTVLCKLAINKGSSQPTPTSDYVAGNCSYVNHRTKMVMMAVIACTDSTKKILRQYVSNLDDSNDDTSVINVKFKDMIDPKIATVIN